MQGSDMNQVHLIAIIVFSLILGSNAFSYKEAKNWGKQYPECNGKKQSPIMLNQTRNDFAPIKKILQFKDFEKIPKKLTIKNTGHTVEIKADWSGKPPRLTGGPLHGNYVFEKTTFHWAQKAWTEETACSASQENCLRDMEMHMFFYRTDLKSFEKAQSQKGGLAVFKVWLMSGYLDDIHLFDNLEKNLHKVQSINSTAVIPPFALVSFIDHRVPAFLFYEGSLDYPPCSESVTWFIYQSDFPINETLLNGFRKIKFAEKDVSNVRPTQALNKRQIKVVFNEEGHYM